MVLRKTTSQQIWTPFLSVPDNHDVTPAYISLVDEQHSREIQMLRGKTYPDKNFVYIWNTIRLKG